jgi:hypothetical protein
MGNVCAMNAMKLYRLNDVNHRHLNKVSKVIWKHGQDTWDTCLSRILDFWVPVKMRALGLLLSCLASTVTSCRASHVRRVFLSGAIFLNYAGIHGFFQTWSLPAAPFQGDRRLVAHAQSTGRFPLGMIKPSTLKCQLRGSSSPKQSPNFNNKPSRSQGRRADQTAHSTSASTPVGFGSGLDSNNSKERSSGSRGQFMHSDNSKRGRILEPGPRGGKPEPGPRGGKPAQNNVKNDAGSRRGKARTEASAPTQPPPVEALFQSDMRTARRRRNIK